MTDKMEDALTPEQIALQTAARRSAHEAVLREQSEALAQPCPDAQPTDVEEAFMRLCETLGIPATAGAYLEARRFVDTQPTDATQSGFSFPGGYVKGDRASVDAVKQMFHAKERCETLDQMLDNKELVRRADTASADYARAIEDAARTCEKVASGELDFAATDDPDMCAEDLCARYIRALASVPKNGGRS